MISGMEGISYVEAENPYAAKASKDLGRDEFLTMFLAQLKYQDPMSPMEGTEFSSQLAQFSSLEQLFNMNDNLENILSAQNGNSTYQVLDMIGKEVEAQGNILSIQEGGKSQYSFITEEVAECMILITDIEGNPVRQLNMGILNPGQHSFEWDGLDHTGKPVNTGNYLYEVSAVNYEGDSIKVAHRVRGLVDRVKLDGDEPVLYVGSIPIGLSQILNVNMPKTETET